MKRTYRVLSPLFLCALLLVTAHAQSPRRVQTDFKETTLKNGLRVITVEDHNAPVIAGLGLVAVARQIRERHYEDYQH